jgi:hypothetical protein
LIYSDVWGPAVDSFGNKNYYASFIDDFSKFTWLYLLGHKFEVFKFFKEFQCLVEHMFNRKILAMQTDLGGEYEHLNSFFRTIGIYHHVFCPHTHQHNGVAERKHQHIIEVGLALLAHASMPLKFWDQAYHTTGHLINQTPSKHIEYAMPLHRLLGATPDYSSIRVFGCACWPNMRPYNSHKLQFCSMQCAFFGYSNLHKDYKCLDINSGRVCISHDVLFYESVFSFAELKSNAGLRYMSEVLLLPKPSSNPGSSDLPMDNIHTNPCLFPPCFWTDQVVQPQTILSSEPQQQHRTHLEVDPIPHHATTSCPPASTSATSSEPQQMCHVASLDGPATTLGLTGAAPTTAAPDHAVGSSAGSVPATESAAAPAPTTESALPNPAPCTRLQHGIRKPKVYLDCSIR